GKEMPMDAFNPTELDCESWLRLAKAGGATYAILTCKHHDGFALWPTKHSAYSVAGTPWKNGKGDVVREFVEACRKVGLKVGLYYSPAQWGKYAISFKNEQEYDEYFINQISELLTGYGKIDYLWFDGCGSEGHSYDRERIVNEINKLQPEILTFCDPEWSPGVRWIGNEDGYASLNNPLVVSKTDFSELATNEQILSSAMFLPAECDCKIRSTWFYDNNEETLKSTDELFGMYEMSVGHGSNFLINIGPDFRGLIPDADAKRFLELGERIKRSYGTSLEYTAPVKDGNTYTITHCDVDKPDWEDPTKDKLSNALVISEDLTDGQKITSFSIYAYLPHYKSKKIQVFEGKTVGHKVFCKFSPIRASKYEVIINSSNGEYQIKDIKAFWVQ
ncbi:MAG: alpha-L-fucosidase, partial [Clostridia bacterium]|nr:alpha-L-fucosidase [Clostridia bacterium]